MRKRRPRKWLGLAVLALAFLALPLAFGVSNLFLVSTKGRAFVAARIQRTIQLETTVQGCTWSPWNGFTVYGLLIRQPTPLRSAVSAPMLTAESIRIHPDWRALLKRQIVIRGIEIRKPDLAVAIELLSQIPSAPVEPAIAAKQPDLATLDQPPAEIPSPESVVPTVPPPPIPQADPPLAAKPETSPPQAPVVLTDPTVWVTFTDARLRIVSALSKEPLYRILRIDGGLPIGGKSAGSELVLDGIRVLGNSIPSGVKIPVKWQAPVLNLGVVDAGLYGIDAKLEAKISLTPGIPFLVGGVLPKQDDREIVLSEALRAKLGSIAGQGRVQGLLLAPGTWQGQGIVQALSVETGYAGQKARFDHGQALVIFQGGVLRCLDARMVGEDSSFLGNGMALSDGRFAANLRIVASPESLASISKFTQTDSSPPRLTPLSTPQRAALDLQVFGLPDKIFYQSNPAAKPVLLR